MAEFTCRRSKHFKVEAEDLNSAAWKAANMDIDDLDGSEPEIIVREEGIIQNDVVRRAAHEVIDKFEELLAEHDIYIPDAEREGNEEEAHIFGETYYTLEDEIVRILEGRLW